jgi:leucyl-tRNA synthetase
VAQIRTLTNAIESYRGEERVDGWVLRFALETATRLIAPMTPHLAEELWLRLGRAGLVCKQPWPKADAALAAEEELTLAVQVNGKLRGTIRVAPGTAKDAAAEAALALPNVLAALNGKSPRRVIVVPDRVVNIVV